VTEDVVLGQGDVADQPAKPALRHKGRVQHLAHFEFRRQVVGEADRPGRRGPGGIHKTAPPDAVFGLQAAGKGGRQHQRRLGYAPAQQRTELVQAGRVAGERAGSANITVHLGGREVTEFAHLHHAGRHLGGGVVACERNGRHTHP